MNYKKLSSIFCIALLFGGMLMSSCTKDFVDINTNPNASTVASPQSLLAPTLVSVINANLSRNFRINNELMQVTVTTSSSDARQFHRYEIRPSESDYMWRNWYLQLTDIRDMYDKANQSQQDAHQTFEGISYILDAWVSSLLTDMFGDIPYFESNLGFKEDNIRPEFDSQKDIYQDIFNKLDSANALLKNNIDLPSDLQYADPIFNGSAMGWRKFGNSLYLRLLLRVAHTGELGAVEKISDIVDIRPNNYPIFDNNEESAILRFSGELPYQSTFYNARDFDFNGDKGYSEFFINNLLTLKDPRLPVWATEASLSVYGGMQSASPVGSVPEIESKLQLSLKTEPLMGNMMNYSELQFILAEAALNNYINGDALDYYNQGVISGIRLWGQDVDSVTYFANPVIDLDQSADYAGKLGKIQLQRYFSMLFTDFQQWYEYRRTKALDLYIGPGVANNGMMPSRLSYPILVRTFNPENYQKAVAAMGGDSINEKVWWEKN